VVDLGELALLIPCSYCGAQPGQRCLRRRIVCRGMSRAAALKHYGPTGTASYDHSARTRPVWAIYGAGLDDGRLLGREQASR
jgi:hypothetical protein